MFVHGGGAVVVYEVITVRSEMHLVAKTKAREWRFEVAKSKRTPCVASQQSYTDLLYEAVRIGENSGQPLVSKSVLY